MAAQQNMRDELALWVKFWNQTEGRDKLCKMLQYGCRGLAYALQSNKELSGQLGALFKATADARKIFRLGKSVNEYTKLKEIANGKEPDTLVKAANFLSRAGFLAYWVYDNLFILAKVKFIVGDQAKYNKRAALFWTIGLLFGVLLELYKLHKSLEQERAAHLAAARAAAAAASGSQVSAQPPAELLKKIREDRTTIYINLAKNFGDLITATNGIELPHKILGHGFNDGLIAVGGFTSAALTCYQLYPAK